MRCSDHVVSFRGQDPDRHGGRSSAFAGRIEQGCVEVSDEITHHILSVLVQNRPGVLARVAGLFARRGFNIFSLAVAPAEADGMSRITIVVDVESTPLEQITKQLFKLVEVIKISELDPRRSVERELLLVTVRAQPETRGQVMELVTVFEAKILAVGAEALTVSLEGHPDKLDDFEELLAPYGIVELQRTGRVALPKLDRQARLRRERKDRLMTVLDAAAEAPGGAGVPNRLFTSQRRDLARTHDWRQIP